MKPIQQSFAVQFEYGIYFTQNLFQTDNLLLRSTVQKGNTTPAKLFFVIDNGVAEAHPYLTQAIQNYTSAHADALKLVAEPLLIPGGEECKNNPEVLQQVLESINQHGICRHSYLVAIGGGAVLDLAGFAAAIAHRGIRHIRIPTTVLSQNDSGVGVKNSMNAFGKKNFLGTFAPPVAVINDSNFLLTLEDRDWRAGISEAVKVALIKDTAFYQSIKADAELLKQRDMAAMSRLIHRCAEMHVEHIGGGDPFEFGSSRPLDFGHWAAHKLEQLSEFNLRHGEAVAIGIALDVVYAKLKGMLSADACDDIVELLHSIGLAVYDEHLATEENKQLSILKGLTEFREHLGGQLTIMLLEGIGHGVEVHHIDEGLVTATVKELKLMQQRFSASTITPPSETQYVVSF
ncbi:3-dehydroquinate synthase [Pontibacter sp. KCTC 32443]|uniref:3-dehydroquinate synthase n=1 Tax=Pontibacter TaxID=323449 RepID=UPI00164E47AD|nr:MULTISPECIES: 3-dehydroquinate synthase [Pontibacter]MBC5772997.1 3-dehydroquinate synthase [Pontibacter sp. KCTC 32443]